MVGSTCISEFLPIVLECSTEYVRERYKSRKQLEASCWFMRNDLMDAPPGDLKLLNRMGYFPWLEAVHELSDALDQSVLGFHRASYDHQRRSLELILAGTWFVSGQTTKSDAQDWISARSETPRFTRMLKHLCKESLHASLGSQNWLDRRSKKNLLGSMQHFSRSWCPEQLCRYSASPWQFQWPTRSCVFREGIEEVAGLVCSCDQLHRFATGPFESCSPVRYSNRGEVWHQRT